VAAIRVFEYLEISGRSPWRRWFNDLDAIGAAHKAWEDYKQRRRNGAA